MLSSEVSNVLLLSEVKGIKAFSVMRTQACLLVEVIEPTPAYQAEKEFISKAVQRIFGRAVNQSRMQQNQNNTQSYPSPKRILFVYLMVNVGLWNLRFMRTT